MLSAIIGARVFSALRAWELSYDTIFFIAASLGIIGALHSLLFVRRLAKRVERDARTLVFDAQGGHAVDLAPDAVAAECVAETR